MGKAEIIAELERLSPQELAEVQARLDQIVAHDRASMAGVMNSTSTNRATPPRLRSPRLANPSQARDFAKQVTDLLTDAKV